MTDDSAHRNGKLKVISRVDGNYTLEEIANMDLILDTHDSWFDEDSPKRLVVEEFELLAQTVADTEEPVKAKSADQHDETREDDMVFLCGLGKHIMAQDQTPIKVRSDKGYSFVCTTRCLDEVPKDLFRKKINYTVKDLLAKGVRSVPLNKITTIKKANETLEKLAQAGEMAKGFASIFSPIKSFIEGFATGPYAVFAFNTAQRRSIEAGGEYTILYILGKGTGYVTAAACIGGSLLAPLIGRFEPILLLTATNGTSFFYESIRSKRKEQRFTPEDAYRRFHDRLFEQGYEIARCKKTKKTQGELAIRLSSRQYADRLSVLTKEARTVARECGVQADWLGPKSYDKKSVCLYIRFEERPD